jgi:hypothetical protein
MGHGLAGERSTAVLLREQAALSGVLAADRARADATVRLAELSAAIEYEESRLILPPTQ